ncbi:MAG: HEAT repeat domain-containing protein, partial [Phycisphaerae bacterium]|nr:HEAT repeat domain-containing protein [Phycisphaerae bacterium]
MIRPTLVRTVRLCGVAGVLAGALLVAGCEGDALKKAEQQESILAFLTPATPLEAAQAMVDPYDADKRFRGTAMIAHAPFGGEAVYVKIYVDHLQNDPDMGVRAVSARALGLHGGPEHAPMIAPLLKSPDRTVRLEAARALQRLHNPEVVDALLAAAAPERIIRTQREETRTGEADAQVRAEACIALGQYAQPKVLNVLIDAVD